MNRRQPNPRRQQIGYQQQPQFIQQPPPPTINSPGSHYHNFDLQQTVEEYKNNCNRAFDNQIFDSAFRRNRGVRETDAHGLHILDGFSNGMREINRILDNDYKDCNNEQDCEAKVIFLRDIIRSLKLCTEGRILYNTVKAFVADPNRVCGSPNCVAVLDDILGKLAGHSHSLYVQNEIYLKLSIMINELEKKRRRFERERERERVREIERERERIGLRASVQVFGEQQAKMRAEHELSLIRLKNEELAREKKEIDETNLKLKADIESASQELGKLKTTLNQKEKELEKIERAVRTRVKEAVEGRTKFLNKQVQEKNDTIASARKDIERLEKRYKEVSTQRTATIEEAKANQQEKLLLEQKLNRKRLEIRELEREFDRVINKIRENIAALQERMLVQEEPPPLRLEREYVEEEYYPRQRIYPRYSEVPPPPRISSTYRGSDLVPSARVRLF